DKAAEHLQAAIRSATASVLRRGDDKDGRKIIEGLQQELDALNAEIKERGEKFDVGATDLALREKAQALVQLGLHKRALDLLLQADSAQIDREEASMQLNLLLAVGQPELVRQRFQEVEGLKEVLRTANYERLNFLLAVLGSVMGDYRDAGGYLDG